MPNDTAPNRLAAPDRRVVAVLLAALAVHVVIAWWMRIPSVSWGEDDAAYLLLARELRHFGYHEIQDIAAPFHARFPPLFPLLIAIVGAPFGDRLDALLVMQTSLSIATVLLFFDAMRRATGEPVALVAAVLFAINPSAIHDSGHLMAEPLFKFFTILSLWGATRDRESVRFAVLAGGAAIAAALTRTAGVVFLPALFLYWMVTRRYRWAAIFFVCSAVTVGAWLGWTIFAPEAENRRLYIADLGVRPNRPRFAFIFDIVRRLPTRLQRLFINIIPSQMALPTVPGTGVDNAAWFAAIVGVGGAGFLVMLRRWRIAAAYSAFYLLLLMSWRYSLERFANPLVPFGYAALLLGALALTARLGPTARRGLVGVLVALLALGALDGHRERWRGIVNCDRSRPVDSPGCWTPEYRAYLKAARWVRDSVPSDAVFFVPKERAFFLHSGHRTINQDRGMQEDSLSLAPYLRSRGVGYTVVTPVGLRSDMHGRLIATACRDFALVRAFPHATTILRVRSADESPDDGRTCRALANWRKPSKPVPDE